MYQQLYEEVAQEASLRIRQDEQRAFRHAIGLMEKARKSGVGSRESVEAIFFLNRLWGVLLEDLSRRDNELPDDLRAKLISIGIWILALRRRNSSGQEVGFPAAHRSFRMHQQGPWAEPMIIHLKKNEKLFINGAVIMLDRRGSIELLNDAQFLLASHVMQVEDATTPLRRLYFVVQTMIVDPANSELTGTLFDTHLNQLRGAVSLGSYQELLDTVKQPGDRDGILRSPEAASQELRYGRNPDGPDDRPNCPAITDKGGMT